MMNAPRQILIGNQRNKNEMGVACGTYGAEGSCIQGFGWGDLRERDRVEDLGVDGRSLLSWRLKK